MEASFISAEQRTSKAKTLAIVSLAVVGTLAACFLVFNQAAVSTSLDDRTAAYDSYGTWKQKNGFTFGGAEDKIRFENYYANYEIVKAHNLKESSYKLTMTPFAAMDLTEFSATHLGYKRRERNAHQVRFAEFNTTELAAEKDWTTEGAVTPVKNQGQCGSCWAFSTTGSVEGALAIKDKTLVNLSEQDLVDCSGEFGNQGCNGGLMDNGFQYIIKNGIALESDYPYTGVDGTCKTTVQRQHKITGFKDVSKNNADQLKAAIAQQPVSVAIEADTSAFQLFHEGVITGSACGTQLDHGVLAVGYGTLDGKAYFKVKNSWGADWGLKGFVNIGIENGAGVCGIQEDASFPIA